MSTFDTPTLKKLEDYPLWKDTSDLVEKIYGLLASFPEEEKWYTGTKLRGAANDLLLSIAQALGNSAPDGRERDWSQVRRAATALKAMYRFAGRQKFFELDPDVMVAIDGILKAVDKEVEAGYKQTHAVQLKEMEHWQKKYALWSKMNHEN